MNILPYTILKSTITHPARRMFEIAIKEKPGKWRFVFVTDNPFYAENLIDDEYFTVYITANPEENAYTVDEFSNFVWDFNKAGYVTDFFFLPICSKSRNDELHKIFQDRRCKASRDAWKAFTGKADYFQEHMDELTSAAQSLIDKINGKGKRAEKENARLLPTNEALHATVKQPSITSDNYYNNIISSEKQYSDSNSYDMIDYIYEDDKGNERISCPLLSEHIRQTIQYIFVKDDAKDTVQRYIYENGYYKLVSDDEFKGVIKQLIPLMLQKTKDINEVFNLLITDNKFISRDKVNDNENIINFQNGLLFLDTLELKPHSPEYISTVQIPCNWIENAPKPDTAHYDRYINKLTNGDKEKENLILQFLGMAISNIKGYRPKKALFMVGEGNTGKSQIRKLAGQLVGMRNNSNIDMVKLETPFGASAIYGKRLIGSADMSYMAVAEVETFKHLTGGDDMQFEFKYEIGFTAEFKGVAWFCCNRLPKFGGDKGQHVYDRMAILECNNVIPENEQDPYICDKMLTEAEYIVFLAVTQLKKVIDNRMKYIIPPECDNAKERYQVENNPVLQFIEECTTTRSTTAKFDGITKGQAYKAYKRYCITNGIKFIETAQQFKSILTDAGKGEINIKDGNRYFEAFTLTVEAQKEFLDYWIDNDENSNSKNPFL